MLTEKEFDRIGDGIEDFRENLCFFIGDLEERKEELLQGHDIEGFAHYLDIIQDLSDAWDLINQAAEKNMEEEWRLEK